MGHIPVHVVPDAYFRDHQTPLISGASSSSAAMNTKE